MIHARQMGETFGAAVSEFSIKNKPVITCRGYDNAHLDILKDKAIIYNPNIAFAITFLCISLLPP